MQILREAYPDAALVARHDPEAAACRPLPEAAAWLAREQPRWQRSLAGEAGFRAPTSVQLCRLDRGRPHAVAGLDRIHVAGIRSLEDRLTVAHEYLHLAFDGHPRARDEAFIESRARALLGLDAGVTGITAAGPTQWSGRR